jgi:hypothetical protein
MSRFSFAPKDDWGINNSVKRIRRNRLLGETPFDEIVARICAEAKLVHVSGPEDGREGDKIGLHRWSVSLQASPEAIDLWHNSRGGYRAQYYVSQDAGEAANAYALEQLTKLTKYLMQTDQYRRRYWRRASVSICHPFARVWIHQGSWCRSGRRAKLADRLLHVQRWRVDPRDDGDRQTKKVLGTLIPENETKLKIIGQWLVDADHPSAVLPKEKRANHINKCGFT